MQQLAVEAIQIQDASNPLGLTKGFATALQELRDCLAADGLPNDTNAIRSHPIHRLWASKIHDLAGMGLSDTDCYGEAYAACRELAGG